jgi:hypothetical protein
MLRDSIKEPEMAPVGWLKGSCARMPRYYFSITSERPFDDVDGLDLPDLAAAREEASGFARDLIRMEPGQRNWLSWSVRVTGEDQQQLFDLPFLDAPFMGDG